MEKAYPVTVTKLNKSVQVDDLLAGATYNNSKEERSPALKVSPASSANVSQAVDKADDAPAGTEPGEGMDATGAITKRPREDKADGEQNTGDVDVNDQHSEAA
ncbi:hypothetical protein HPB47_008006 [Ixodes persulcatus]|uniref:Uncharacterized protein n=1 Tax=Ixodes persulcatus TaxID=34615 RepID=A0AC60P5X5_IXOPE|nr:hypothetical protein HPB47_008006 [Ixodes persulcatus]